MKASDSPKQRTIVEILQDSLADKPYKNQTKYRSLDDTQNEVRYKLIIDRSEDESITRLLFMFGILKFENTRTFMCSNFPGDSQLQKVIILLPLCYIYTLIILQLLNITINTPR